MADERKPAAQLDDDEKAEREKLRRIGGGLRRACEPGDKLPDDMAKLMHRLQDFNRPT